MGDQIQQNLEVNYMSADICRGSLYILGGNSLCKKCGGSLYQNVVVQNTPKFLGVKTHINSKTHKLIFFTKFTISK